MAKIGTAHIEIKPVLNEAAMDHLVKRIEDAVAAGVRRGLEQVEQDRTLKVKISGAEITRALSEVAQLGYKQPGS